MKWYGYKVYNITSIVRFNLKTTDASFIKLDANSRNFLRLLAPSLSLSYFKDYRIEGIDKFRHRLARIFLVNWTISIYCPVVGVPFGS